MDDDVTDAGGVHGEGGAVIELQALRALHGQPAAGAGIADGLREESRPASLVLGAVPASSRATSKAVGFASVIST